MSLKFFIFSLKLTVFELQFGISMFKLHIANTFTWRCIKFLQLHIFLVVVAVVVVLVVLAVASMVVS